MVNQTLIWHILPAIGINKIFKRRNKFISDIRTTPTSPTTFQSDMNAFHRQFKYAIRFFDGLSFITPFMKEYILEGYKLKQLKTVCWSSGVDPALFDPEKYKSERNDDAFKILYHGGISISRGNLDLIKAVHSLVGGGYKIELTQVGILVDKEIEDYCDENNITSWCKLLPPVSLVEIPQLIADCDLPVLPFPDFMAWRVSSPIKLMEYLAMGKKVLVPNMECFTNVFASRTDIVFYYDTKNDDPIRTIADSIRFIVDKKKLVSRNFFPEIRQFVTDNYTWEKQAAKLFEFCKSL
jgi:glycosyltransferase involved in cell wall biosynthesis